jgi:hypothetical protein
MFLVNSQITAIVTPVARILNVRLFAKVLFLVSKEPFMHYIINQEK